MFNNWGKEVGLGGEIVESVEAEGRGHIKNKKKL